MPWDKLHCILAADRGSVEAVKILLDARVDPNTMDQDGFTAVIADRFEVCQTPLLRGADPHQSDPDGNTPRSCAFDADNECLDDNDDPRIG